MEGEITMLSSIMAAIRSKLLKPGYLDSDFDKHGAATNKELDLFWRDELRVKNYLIQERLDFFKEVTSKIPYTRNIKSVIDVGCGSGHVLYYYAKMHNLSEKNLCANEISINALVQANKLLPKANLLRADLLSLPNLFKHTFDLAIATEIMEHLKNPKKYLLCLIALLKPGAIALITIPNGDIDNWEGHVNFWNEAEFKKFLDQFAEIKVNHSEQLASGDLLFVIKKNKVTTV